MSHRHSITGSLIAALIFVGCVSTYERTDVAPNQQKLVSSRSIVVATPLNGSYGGKIYENSGAATAAAIRAAFSRHTTKASISKCVDLRCLRVDADAPGDYYVVADLLRWEDRATEWSGIKDKLEIKITIYDGSNGNEVASTIIFGKSKWATFGGDHPQDLLPAPLEAYIKTLY